MIFKLKNKQKNNKGFTAPEVGESFDKFKDGKPLTGFTVVEVIVAISVLAFGIVAVYGAFSTVVVLTHNISLRFTAAYLAQEGLEVIRNIRDNNFIGRAQDPELTWSDGLVGSPCDLGCMLDYKTKNPNQLLAYNDDFLELNSDGFYSYDEGGTPTIFKRKIIVSPVLGFDDAINIYVLVSWKYNGKLFSFTSNENLYNWY